MEIKLFVLFYFLTFIFRCIVSIKKLVVNIRQFSELVDDKKKITEIDRDNITHS